MDDAEKFFLSEAVTHARSLNISDAVLFLRGLLQSCSDSQAAANIRSIYIALSESDRQLQLFTELERKS